MLRQVWACVILASVSCVVPCRAAEPPTDPREMLGHLIDEAEAAYAKVQDYTATFTKQERIGGLLGEPDRFFMKFSKPFQVYLRWPDDAPNGGMEAIYVQGENKDKILVHPAGLADLLVPTAEIDVAGEAAMKNNRHPITHLGIGYFLERFGADFRRADQNDEITVYYRGVRRIESRDYHEVEIFLEPRQGNPGYYCYRSVLFFDVEHHLPMRMLFYNWENDLQESYAYTNLVLNPGLTAADFDPRNKSYHFGLFPPWGAKAPAALSVGRVMPGCRAYTKVVIQEKTEIFPWIQVSVPRTYYVGYGEEGAAPLVIATEAKTLCWFNDLRFLVGLRRDGKTFRITDAIVTNDAEVMWDERKLLVDDTFVRQFHDKDLNDRFEVGSDIGDIPGATLSVAGSTLGIRRAAEALKVAFDNAALRDAGAAAPKTPLGSLPSPEKGRQQ